jgi:hypothetical protein
VDLKAAGMAEKWLAKTIQTSKFHCFGCALLAGVVRREIL